MTNSIALGLGLALVAGILADVLLNDSNALVFLGKELFDLIEYLAFWR